MALINVRPFGNWGILKFEFGEVHVICTDIAQYLPFYQEVLGFEIAGSDRKWFPAKAEILGDKIVLTAADVKQPVVVRYLYTLNTDHGTLYNKEGLPASPFRTDNW